MSENIFHDVSNKIKQKNDMEYTLKCIINISNLTDELKLILNEKPKIVLLSKLCYELLVISYHNKNVTKKDFAMIRDKIRVTYNINSLNTIITNLILSAHFDIKMTNKIIQNKINLSEQYYELEL
jgi:hypothetical protein